MLTLNVACALQAHILQAFGCLASQNGETDHKRLAQLCYNEFAAAPSLSSARLMSVFKLHGAPQELVTDRDPRFISAFWTEACQLMQIKRSMSTAYHPQSDGQTERINRILEDMLRHYVRPSQTDWDKHLPLVEFAINNAYQESVKATPFMLNHGQHPHTPASICIGTGRNAAADPKRPLADRFTDEMHKVIAQAKQSFLSAQRRQKAYHDRKARAKQWE